MENFYQKIIDKYGLEYNAFVYDCVTKKIDISLIVEDYLTLEQAQDIIFYVRNGVDIKGIDPKLEYKEIISILKARYVILKMTNLREFVKEAKEDVQKLNGDIKDYLDNNDIKGAKEHIVSKINDIQSILTTVDMEYGSLSKLVFEENEDKVLIKI